MSKLNAARTLVGSWKFGDGRAEESEASSVESAICRGAGFSGGFHECGQLVKEGLISCGMLTATGSSFGRQRACAFVLVGLQEGKDQGLVHDDAIKSGELLPAGQEEGNGLGILPAQQMQQSRVALGESVFGVAVLQK